MNNDVNQNEQILEQVKKMMLEQQVSELGNSLSSTISFFSMVLAAGAIVFAIIIAGVSWWFNRLFSEKLKKVEEIERNVKNELLEVKQIRQNTDTKYSEIKEIYSSIQNSKHKLDKVIKENLTLKTWNEYLQEKIEMAENNIKFMKLVLEIEDKLKKVTQNDIVKFYTDKKEGNPQKQFELDKKYYLDAKKAVEYLDNIEYEFFDFMGDKESGTVSSLSEEISYHYADADEFLKVLNELLK